MEGMSVIAFKLCSVGTILVISLVGSFLPLKLRTVSAEKRNMVTDLSRFFTAGVFLGVGLIHMLPEAADNLQKLGIGRVGKRNFPVAYLICALGVVIIWFLEQHTFRDRSRMMAVAANAHKRGGASICFVRVEPVSTYGMIVDSSDGSRSPVVRIRPAPPSYVPPLLQNVDETRALLLPAEGVSSGRGVWEESEAVRTGPPAEDVRLLIPLEGQQPVVEGGKEVLIPVRSLREAGTGGSGEVRIGGESQGSDLEAGGAAVSGNLKKAGRRSSGDDGHSCSSHSSLHRTGSGPEGGGSLSRENSAKRAKGGQRRGGAKLKRNESGSLWSPQAINCPVVLHEDLFTHPEHRHRHTHSEPGGHSGHSHEGFVSPPCPPDDHRQLHHHSHTAEHHHVMLSGGSGMAYILASLFSLHSFVVGAAFGIGREIDQGAISLLIAVLAHKGTEAFSVGVQFAAEGVPLSRVVTIMLLYCAMTPLGVFVGMAELLVRGTTGRIVESITQAFGAGTVLYIVMMQLTDQDGMGALPNRWVQAALILLGLGIMSAVALVA
ncbi:hypothetical protein KFL_002740050 [Klebsormidium nitens]|uniref:Uncharacterized protein n=1 Tax=Klebsormidium nitens TaxID=105231 RepID=A0A1Y1IBS7_KLENI|nr:hypothetical protein KFL_002740050 [Klebsormidium nitens]|eukprot:GAQ86166.1 hypothetical protein KFL_002740050 [Klebsormidium nitens]